MTDVRTQRGAASVEAAVILALFLVPLLMGLVDASRLILARIAIQEAAQEGALFLGFEETTTPGAVVTQVMDSIDSPTILPGEVTVGCSNVARTEGTYGEVSVRVAHEVDLIFPLLGTSVTVERVARGERFFECPAGFAAAF